MADTTVFFAVVGVLGMFSQWLAWRFAIPAIIVLLVAGLALGPGLHLIVPVEVLGGLMQPMIAVAVAVILFEGGLSLDFRGLRDASQAVVRIVLVAAPMTWIMTSACAHYLMRLSWPTAAVIGGILVVTGPTVVQPLLRHAKLESRPAAVLRWEAIVNDPIGALFAVLAYEVYAQTRGVVVWQQLAVKLAALVAVAGVIGYATGLAVAYAYRTVHVPEYLKVPALFVAVLACFVGGNLCLGEAGLLSVTIMGVTVGNSRIASLSEIRRFKEHAAVLLVSGVFVILTANIDARIIRALDWRALAFTVALILVIRPVAIFASTIVTNLNWRERLLISWVAPRGVVAVATSGIFGAALVSQGAADGAVVPALVFGVVLGTVVLFGLTTVPIARVLRLASTEVSGVLIVGCNSWTLALATALTAMSVPVMIADRSWRQLKPARAASIATYYGEILAEAAAHRLDHARFADVIAATESHAYNTLVCTDWGPHFGREHVFQIGRMESEELDPEDIALSLGGRTLLKAGYDLDSLNARLNAGWAFRKTTLTDEFTFEAYRLTLSEDAQIILAVKPNGAMAFATIGQGLAPESGESILTFDKGAEEGGR